MVKISHSKPRRRRLIPHFSRRTKLVVAAFALLFTGVLAYIPFWTYSQYASEIADRNRLMNHNNTGIVLLDRYGETFYSRGVTRDIKEVALTEISPTVVDALLASEDEDFYSNPGFSAKGIGRALYSNVTKGDLTGSGGSSITQQLVKNNLLTADKNFLRKYQEVSMAVAIDQKYTKNEILEMYLNSVYFGSDAYGIESAANNYFNKSAKELNLSESTMLVGLLPAPSAYSPTLGDPELAKVRQNYVLSRMVAEGMITTEEKAAAYNIQLAYKANDGPVGKAYHFALMVLDELSEKYDEETITRSGLRVRTTLDLKWQSTAEAEVQKQVAKLASANATNGSLVAIDSKTGEVRALVGSADWNNEQFGKVNMAITPRQPGSSFKPLYFTEAIAQKKITAATVLKDEPTDFGNGYRPTNYDLKYSGDVSVRKALAASMNIPAVDVMRKIGVSNSIDTAQRLGISTIKDEPERYGLALALGTAEARLLDMTNAYSAIANHGKQSNPVLIKEINDKFGEKIYEYEPEVRQVIDQNASYVMSSILSDEKARAPLWGDKFSIGRPVAVKSGTTNDNKDAWTIGYTPGVTVGVWVGNNNNMPMRGIGGSTGAGPIWRAAMTTYVQDTSVEDFQKPKSVIHIEICVVNTKYREFFIQGTEKGFKCSVPPPKAPAQPKKVDREDIAPEPVEAAPDEKMPKPPQPEPAIETETGQDPRGGIGGEPPNGSAQAAPEPSQPPTPEPAPGLESAPESQPAESTATTEA